MTGVELALTAAFFPLWGVCAVVVAALYMNPFVRSLLSEKGVRVLGFAPPVIGFAGAYAITSYLYCWLNFDILRPEACRQIWGLW